MISVLLADDHPVVRAGIRAMLDTDPEIEVVAEASSGPDAVRRALAFTPQVVLMDLRMPGGDGVAATAEIRAALPATRVLILTTYESDRDILPAVGAGATGYLLKDTTTADLVAAIRAAVRGETVLSPSVAARILGRMRGPAPEPLSPREVQVLQLVARGQTNSEVGRGLNITEATVKTYMLRIFQKLDVSDRTSAVMAAVTAGLISGDPR
ncbi:response regulator [Parafrankia discariae]|uniref:response regulator n=1 Tax=Parafrankia discariae TaxID=365528 RepID=UPI00035FCBA0|nr:response regulator transcription factor [Parafrankia discariae]